MTLGMILFIIFWLICSITSYGFYFAFYQNKYPIAAKRDYIKDMFFSLFFSLFGPVGLVVIFHMKQYTYGLKFT